MPKEIYLSSRKNVARDKDDVVKKMGNKLAGGATVFAAKRRKKAAQFTKRIALASTAVLTVILGGIAIWPLMNKPRKEKTPTTRAVAKKFYQPSKTLETAFNASEISVDQYSTYLFYLLTNYDKIPAYYKKGIPQFTSPEIFAKLEMLWPRLAQQTKREIASGLPSFAKKMGYAGSQESSSEAGAEEYPAKFY
ncbi:MAG: hypothetical protein GF398_09055 [Chitinivibrionales bacterium]|nr:hypothetical protein [Chitinivibrionales bacterium]